MSRLGMLFALEDAQVSHLRTLPKEERYDYMSEEIEEALFDTPRACELDKAWLGLQYCLCGGVWKEGKNVPENIVFGGKVLLETDEEIITLKDHNAVAQITAFLQTHDLEAIIRENFPKITDEGFPYKDENGLEHTLGWSEELLPFYENAHNAHLQVIFTADF